jgi:glycosyltransferase involved in cell wall biosynthesis
MHVLGTARTDPRVMREATALTRAGYTVTVVDVEHDRSRGRQEMLDGVRLRHIMMPGWFISTRFKPWFLVKAARIFLQGGGAVLRTRADVYHAHDDLTLPAMSLAARLRRKPLVFDAHELPLVAPPVTRWRRLNRIARGVVRRYVRRATATVTVSPPMVPELARLYGARNAVVVRNLPTYRQPVNDDRIRRHLGLAPSTRIALYQGYLLPDRRLDQVVRAARYLPDDIVVVMIGSGFAQPALEALIASEGVASRVKMVPFVPHSELLSWTASADIGLILFAPDYSENIRLCLPNKLFEYLMSGLPVLASSLEAVVEVVDTYQVGRIVRQLDPPAIASAITAMLSDEAALAQMRERALRAARERLNWEAETQELIALYRGLTAGRVKQLGGGQAKGTA